MSARLRLGDLSVGFVQSLADALREQGQNPLPLLAEYGLDAARLADPDGRLSIPRYMRLGAAAIERCADPGLGLAMGRLSRLEQVGLAGVTAAQAPDIVSAARALVRFEPLYASNYRGRFSLREDADGAWLQFYSISPYNGYNRFVVDSLLAGWKTQLEALAQQPLRPQRVQFECSAPADVTAHEALFGAPVEFSAPANRLRYGAAQLALGNPRHCPSTWQQLLALCEAQLQQLTRTRSLRERVIACLGPLLIGREPDLESVAEQLRMPPWTLRRKLAEEGSGFRQLLNDSRRDLAIAYIRDTDLAFGEIAYLLGFASAEAFQRAFRRWCGEPPGAFRRSQRRSG